jgi:uncharacterized membrane protein YdbT with pleckstrin-like domain
MTHPFADHQHSLPDGRSNSGGSRRQLFIREVVAFCFGMSVILFPIFFVFAAIILYALFVAEPV